MLIPMIIFLIFMGTGLWLMTVMDKPKKGMTLLIIGMVMIGIAFCIEIYESQLEMEAALEAIRWGGGCEQ